MQMFKRLLAILLLLIMVSACAKLPVESMSEVKDLMSRAYASGAEQHAPGEYQLASSALQAAELQVSNRDYAQAVKTLELAHRYADEALRITAEKNKLLALEAKRVAAKKKQAELKQEELQRQKNIVQQRQREELEKIRQAELKLQDVAPKVPVLVDEIVVKVGENLATIAARKEVYSDSLLWPLIYKANRDQIKSPEEIFSGQVFIVPRDKSNAEADAARHEAMELNLF